MVGRSRPVLEIGFHQLQCRKISFLCPDYAAILSYSLSLGPSHLSLSLNDSPVPGHILAMLREREQSKRTLSFLYQIMSL